MIYYIRLAYKGKLDMDFFSSIRYQNQGRAIDKAVYKPYNLN